MNNEEFLHDQWENASLAERKRWFKDHAAFAKLMANRRTRGRSFMQPKEKSMRVAYNLAMDVLASEMHKDALAFIAAKPNSDTAEPPLLRKLKGKM